MQSEANGSEIIAFGQVIAEDAPRRNQNHFEIQHISFSSACEIYFQSGIPKSPNMHPAHRLKSRHYSIQTSVGRNAQDYFKTTPIHHYNISKRREAQRREGKHSEA